MKNLLIIFITLTLSSTVSAISGGSPSGLIYVCMHGTSEQNLQMYAVTNQSNPCPEPPSHHSSASQMSDHQVLQEKTTSKKKNKDIGGLPIVTVVQHDPDCIVKKVPAHQ